MTGQPRQRLARTLTIATGQKNGFGDESGNKNGDAVTEMVTVFDDDDRNDYKWAEIRDRLGVSSNVANARWMPEKLIPLFENLNAPALLSDKGKPTKFCAQMLFRYKVFCNDAGNDYAMFCQQVRSRFGDKNDDAVKPVTVEVLAFGDSVTENGYGVSSPLSKFETQVGDRDDDLETKIMRAAQAKQAADGAIAKYNNLTAKSWEQEIVEDELAKFTAEQQQKKKEADLRLQVRQMLAGQEGSP